MPEDQYIPSKAEFLAGLVTGSAAMSQSMATVQRSHRFPLHLFVQIENMARMGGVPVSLIINELIECGLEAVKQELPEDVALEVARATNEQVERPTVMDKVEVKSGRATSKPKRERAK
ncbi:MAG: hypothetical protein Q8L71_11300 [Thiobacillus sp.]|nr:hypothetical protein [Thiobacillus sp.]